MSASELLELSETWIRVIKLLVVDVGSMAVVAILVWKAVKKELTRTNEGPRV